MARQSTHFTLEALQAELADPDYKVRKEAIRKLMRYQRQSALEPLLERLGDTRSIVRVKAVLALGRLGDTRALLPLLDLLTDKSVSVRVKVAGVLGSFGDPSVVGPLQALLNDPRSQMRLAAARSLGQLRDFSSLPLLLAYLTRASVDEVYQLARAIGDFDTPGIIEPLLAVCQRNDTLQGVISDGLSRLGVSSTPALLGILNEQTRPAITRSCIALVLGKKPRMGSAQALIEALDDEDIHVRQYAAWALGVLKDPLAIQPLTGLLSDKAEGVCQAALMALSALGATGIDDLLIACLSSQNTSVVYTAALMLKQTRAPGAVSALLEALSRVDDMYAFHLVDALCTLAGPEIIDIVLQRWPEIARGRPWRYVSIFAHFPDQRIVEPLLSLLNPRASYGYEHYMQVQIVRLLAQLGDARALEPLYAMYKQASPALESIVLQALGTLESAIAQRV